MKITQIEKTITADFTNIENQYQNKTCDIVVELTDDTFDGYTVLAAVSNPQYPSQTYTLPIINNFLKLPYYCTDFLATVTISLFGYKGDEVITTNLLDFQIVASNPTNIHYAPTDYNWNDVMQAYVEAQMAQTKGEIAPHIENNVWYIGDQSTGVLANEIPPAGEEGDMLVKQGDSLGWADIKPYITEALQEEVVPQDQVSHLSFVPLTQDEYDALVPYPKDIPASNNAIFTPMDYVRWNLQGTAPTFRFLSQQLKDTFQTYAAGKYNFQFTFAAEGAGDLLNLYYYDDNKVKRDYMLKVSAEEKGSDYEVFFKVMSKGSGYYSTEKEKVSAGTVQKGVKTTGMIYVNSAGKTCLKVAKEAPLAEAIDVSSGFVDTIAFATGSADFKLYGIRCFHSDVYGTIFFARNETTKHFEGLWYLNEENRYVGNGWHFVNNDTPLSYEEGTSAVVDPNTIYFIYNEEE